MHHFSHSWWLNINDDLGKNAGHPCFAKKLNNLKSIFLKQPLFFLKSTEKAFLGAYLDNKGKSNIHLQQVDKISIMQLLSR